MTDATAFFVACFIFGLAFAWFHVQLSAKAKNAIAAAEAKAKRDVGEMSSLAHELRTRLTSATAALARAEEKLAGK